MNRESDPEPVNHSKNGENFDEERSEGPDHDQDDEPGQNRPGGVEDFEEVHGFRVFNARRDIPRRTRNWRIAIPVKGRSLPAPTHPRRSRSPGEAGRSAPRWLGP